MEYITRTVKELAPDRKQMLVVELNDPSRFQELAHLWDHDTESFTGWLEANGYAVALPSEPIEVDSDIPIQGPEVQYTKEEVAAMHPAEEANAE